MTGLAVHLIAYTMNRQFAGVKSRGVRYFAVIWTQIFAALHTRSTLLGCR
jgi:hypothetical protein